MWRLIARNLLTRPVADPAPAPDPAALEALGKRVADSGRQRLGRSLAIRHVDAGSCNACELELHALSNPYHDLERFGLSFVASPRHADVLLVTGPVARNMRDALHATWVAVPEPRWVIAAGACAIDGGCFAGAPEVLGGADAVIPVDLTIPGCPPTPTALLAGLLALLAVER
ncbi:MAG: NADH-quinone oxidoreductase subunit NuoB [Alphaproteobacteria bacterium]|nr:MAG: NADH-quinone oxidoreductase subunit NuoB [Alphaproteobacteria bacterium]